MAGVTTSDYFGCRLDCSIPPKRMQRCRPASTSISLNPRFTRTPSLTRTEPPWGRAQIVNGIVRGCRLHCLSRQEAVALPNTDG
jgi:hypothetical protein